MKEARSDLGGLLGSRVSVLGHSGFQATVSLAVHGAEFCSLGSGLLSTQDNPKFLFLVNRLSFSPSPPSYPS